MQCLAIVLFEYNGFLALDSRAYFNRSWIDLCSKVLGSWIKLAWYYALWYEGAFDCKCSVCKDLKAGDKFSLDQVA